LRVVARVTFIGAVLVAVIGGAGAAVTLAHFGRDLPDVQQVATYVPATGSKVYDGDGKFLIQFESERRIPVAFDKIPLLVKRAFLAAEDRDFYNHNGVNPMAIARAAVSDILRLRSGQRPQGASTITQQVVRHFLLTNEISVSRKVKEALLAYRIEKELSKDRLLDIYLNEIYLGAGAYGVAAAADTYFQKPLDQLSLPQIATLAALPKAPNNYNPVRFPHAAKARRDWVMSGMAEIGWITPEQAKLAIAQPLGVHLRQEQNVEHNNYFAEEVRRELAARFGDKVLYEGGLTIRTSFSPTYQAMADRAYRDGLIAYDRRHGWRGPVKHLPTAAAAVAVLPSITDRPGVDTWKIAAVTSVDAGGADIALDGGAKGRIPMSELGWAGKTGSDQRLGSWVRSAHDVLAVGDIVFVEPTGATTAIPSAGRYTKAAAGGAPSHLPGFALRQVPDVSGGLVVVDPKNGRVRAMVGGWDFGASQFNRVTQAKRQPGSAFKPFVYMTAFENGYTPDSVVDDAPISLPQGPGMAPWTPSNYEGSYSGPSTLRDALIHSRNLVTARLASMIGMPSIAKTVQAFDVMDRMPLYYSMALGAGETTLLRLTAAYAMIDNKGHWLLPSVIDTVQDRDGNIIYQKGVGACASCFVIAGARKTQENSTLYRAGGVPGNSVVPFTGAKYAANPIIYQSTKPDPLVDANTDADIISMMEGVVQRGTGTAVAAVGKSIAGKTGTTSDFFDAWFVGFSPNLAAGVYVGFDNPRTLGDGEVGGKVAAPIFRDFMMAALKDQPATPFQESNPGVANIGATGAATAAASDAGANTANADGASAKPSRRSTRPSQLAKKFEPSDDDDSISANDGNQQNAAPYGSSRAAENYGNSRASDNSRTARAGDGYARRGNGDNNVNPRAGDAYVSARSGDNSGNSQVTDNYRNQRPANGYAPATAGWAGAFPPPPPPYFPSQPPAGFPPPLGVVGFPRAGSGGLY
jgi:penicillin-binding protein 1A